MSRAYYNEIDPYAAQWLRNLIAAGHIADWDGGMSASKIGVKYGLQTPHAWKVATGRLWKHV